MNHNYGIVILLLLIYKLSFSQNLVPNPSFEEGKCPEKYGEISYSKHWSGFSADYFKSCPQYEKYLSNKMSVPYNQNGFQKARTGIAYAGLVSSREILQSHLLQSLKKDSIYYIEFYTNLADSSTYAIWDIGVYLSKRRFNYSWGSHVYDTIVPQVQNYKNNYLTDKINWTKISGFYKAKGGESYLTIGSFDKSSDKELTEALVLLKNAPKRRYYYIDDVFIGNVPKNLTYIFSDIVFKIDESEIQSDFVPQLDLIKDYLKANSNAHIIISGHTDSTGTETNNKALSKARAKSVSDYLIDIEINSSRISYQGYGSNKPISTNETDEGRKLNRRVEVQFVNSLQTTEPNK